MSALDQPKSKPLVVRIGPRKRIEAELREQLKARDIAITSETSLGLSSRTLSSLEAYFWRDILYFLEQEYVEYTAIEKAIKRLRDNPLFTETLVLLTERFNQEETEEQ